MSSLALGTVQFGLDYGINNERGKVPFAEVQAILDTAVAAGIDTLDTAKAYGDSEVVLGRAKVAGRFRLVTKLPAADVGDVKSAIEDSLAKLGASSLYACMFHSYSSYEKQPELLASLTRCKEEGLAEKIGFSLYRPEEATALLDAGTSLDIVQVPYNLLDRRFESVFPRLHEAGVEIHVRSVFLQGLFFMDLETLHPRFSIVREKLLAIQAASMDGPGIQALCLAFSGSRPEIERVVIGVDSLVDLEQNIEAFKRRRESEPELDNLDWVACDDESVILPYNWK